MERVCFQLQVRPDRLEEYRARHREVWPEMLDALREAGWRNYSLFLREDGLLVGYVETDDFEAAQRAMAATEVNERWQRDMAPVLRRARRPRAGAPGGGLPPCLTRRASPPPISVRRADASSSERCATGAWSSTSSIASPTARCACPTACTGTSPGCSQEIVEGLRAAGRVDGVGVDAWGVDYGLLDDGGRLLGLPYHHRDARTAGMVARAFERVPRDALYAATGIQTMAINTVFQLLADEGTPALDAGGADAAHPRPAGLLAQRRGGQRDHRGEHHRPARRADRRRGRPSAIERLGLPARLFGALVEPGTTLGPLLDAPRRRRRAARARRRRSRHRVGLRRRAGRRRRRRDPLQRNLVAARGRADRARARAGRRRREPDQRARRRRDDAAAEERDGPVARAGVPARVGGPTTTTSCIGSRPRRPTTSRSSTPTTRPSWRRATCRRGSPPTASGPASARPRRAARRCARSWSRSRASTAWCCAASSA